MRVIGRKTLISFFAVLLLFVSMVSRAQFEKEFTWSNDGNSYYKLIANEIVQFSLPDNKPTVLVTNENMIPKGHTRPLRVRQFYFSNDNHKILIYTNTAIVWRYDTRGDYWVYDLKDNSLKQLGKSLPASSLMFAKFSPDNQKVAYVSGHNLFVENIATGDIKQLTFDGTAAIINGTFDWVYEEEFDCRDGFRWSPDSKQIAFWQINDNTVRNYLMLNTTDSVYSKVIPVEYPVTGQVPSLFKIGVADIGNAQTKWMNIPTDPEYGSYLTRMEWAANSNQLIVQHLNRRQNESDLMMCDVNSGAAQTIYSEKDTAWIDILSSWDGDYRMGGWDWLNNGKDFLWASDKDGWRHLYKISRDGKKEVLITVGNYDVIAISRVDEKSNYVYYLASPTNATQQYLYRSRLDGKGKAELVSPTNQIGTHEYEISPTAKYANHKFSNHYTPEAEEWITLPDHNVADHRHNVYDAVTKADKSKSNVEFFKVRTVDGIDMDGWMSKPLNFDSTKKYPVLFFVYTEAAQQTAKDIYGVQYNPVYMGDMAADGYIYMSLDNRGSPVPKGNAWRKAIHRNVGVVNIRDQAMAAKEILKWKFVDPARIAVWGWSGGASATLNLMFQYPDIYSTGLAVSAVTNLLTYDNVYEERYMGLPVEDRKDYIKGSPITYAKNLKGNLLYMHGTGDDNVHYNNAEMLINELVKYNKQFRFMSYPNRTHAMSEGPGTALHLATLYTSYLNEHCPGGPK
ncbi:MAG: S9 family peptidase [Bacteroidetes bacterium]|nr:S9 family peptidase [Bacteroidota bacterium]